MSSILVVEDSETLRNYTVELLSADQYDVDATGSGQEALSLSRRKEYQAILLDLDLPDSDGLTVCAEIKKFSEAYVIMVTGRDSQIDKIIGLEAGADDYITKPFDSLELLLRLGKATKRVQQPAYASRIVGDIEMLSAARQVKIAGKQTALTKIEFDLLAHLFQHVGESSTREQLAIACWGSAEWLGNGHALNVHMVNMRRKISASQAVKISAVRGIGYRLDVLTTVA